MSITELAAGRSVLQPQQVERARLWLWFYRTMADVSTSLVPVWALSNDATVLAATAALRHVEPDGDPLFLAMRRMWERRDPLISRFDVTTEWLPVYPRPLRENSDSPSRTEPDRALTQREASVRFDSGFERLTRLTPPSTLSSGLSHSLTLADGLVRGVSVVGRATEDPMILGLGLDDGPKSRSRLDLHIRLDRTARKWWGERAPQPHRRRTKGRRGDLARLLIVTSGDRFSVVRLPMERTARDGPIRLAVPVHIEGSGSGQSTTLVSVGGPAGGIPAWAKSRLLPSPVVGIQFDELVLSEGDQREDGMAMTARAAMDLVAGWTVVLPGEASDGGGGLRLAFRRLSGVGGRGQVRVPPRFWRRRTADSPASRDADIRCHAQGLVSGRPLPVTANMTAGETLRMNVVASDLEPILVGVDDEDVGLLGDATWARQDPA